MSKDPFAAKLALDAAERDLVDFHRAVGAVIGDGPGLRDEELRARLIAEEAAETVVGILGRTAGRRLLVDMAAEAYQKSHSELPDLVEAVDGCIDTIYVAIGALVAFGVPAGACWEIVHAANMAKIGGPKDAGGKALEPPGWVSPNEQIRSLLIDRLFEYRNGASS